MSKIIKRENEVIGLIFGSVEGNAEDIETGKAIEIAGLFGALKDKPGYEPYISMDDFGNTSILYRKKEAEKMSRDEILHQLIDDILSAIPIDEVIPKKLGYIIIPRFAAGRIQWGYRPDPNYRKTAAGTYTDPIPYKPGMEVTAVTNTDPFTGDGWYSYEGDIKRCFKSGVPTGFDDDNFFTY